MTGDRIWLDVPFRDKDEAKALGALWDPVVRRWYAPRAGLATLRRWAPPSSAKELEPVSEAERTLRRQRLNVLRNEVSRASRSRHRVVPAKKPPAEEQVTPEQLHAVLDAVFPSQPPERGTNVWITIPPWNWFCHMCDSNAGPADIATAHLRTTRRQRHEIVCQPNEWRHSWWQLKLPQAVQEAAEAAGRAVLTGPGMSAVWISTERRFEVVTGTQIDWREDGRRR